MAQLFEVIMLLCFGISWPMNAYKAYKSGTAESTSLGFILMILFGYVCGIGAKIISGNVNYVLIVYVINIITVSTNLLVYLRNKHLDKLHHIGAASQTAAA